jgi:hypothetical protein
MISPIVKMDTPEMIKGTVGMRSPTRDDMWIFEGRHENRACSEEEIDRCPDMFEWVEDEPGWEEYTVRTDTWQGFPLYFITQNNEPDTPRLHLCQLASLVCECEIVTEGGVVYGNTGNEDINEMPCGWPKDDLPVKVLIRRGE